MYHNVGPSLGATAINTRLLLNPAILAAFADPRVNQCAQQGGTWDATSKTCSVGGGIPTWGYVAGGAVIAGAAWFFLFR